MKISLPSEFSDASPPGAAQRLRSYWSGRRGLFALGAAAVALGVGLNWGWLAAAGITPVLVGLLPCAAMCALGLCMPGMMKKTSRAPEAARDITLQATRVASSPRLQLASSSILPKRTSIDRQPTVEGASFERAAATRQKQRRI